MTVPFAEQQKGQPMAATIHQLPVRPAPSPDWRDLIAARCGITRAQVDAAIAARAGLAEHQDAACTAIMSAVPS